MASLVCLLALAGLFQQTGSIEYCQFEVFNASCTGGHVIVVETAVYGRMRTGRCVSRDYGYMGCSVNVLQVLDRFCSGRPSCDFGVPRLRELVQPCPRDLMAFLEASYRCISVMELNQLNCNSTLALDRSTPVLYISGTSNDLELYPPRRGISRSYSSSSSSSSFSSPSVTVFHSCPIHFRTLPRQAINLTLLSFGYYPDPDEPNQSGILQFCPEYLFIVESSRRHSGPLCPAKKRERHFYQSHDHRLSLYFSHQTTTGQLTDRWTFILKVEVTGCADYPNPAGAWVERVNSQKTIVRCNDTHETWYLTCKGKEWTGIISNCTEVLVVGSHEEKMSTDDTARIPFGLVVAVSSGIVLGFVVGFSMLTFVFIHRKRTEAELKTEAVGAADADIASRHYPEAEMVLPQSTSGAPPFPERYFLQCHYRSGAAYGHTVTSFTDRDLFALGKPLAPSHSSDLQKAESSCYRGHTPPEVALPCRRKAMYADRRGSYALNGSHVNGELGIDNAFQIRDKITVGGRLVDKPNTSETVRNPDLVPFTRWPLIRPKEKDEDSKRTLERTRMVTRPGVCCPMNVCPYSAPNVQTLDMKSLVLAPQMASHAKTSSSESLVNFPT